MAFHDGLLPFNGWGEDGRTIGRVLVYRLCKKDMSSVKLLKLHPQTAYFARDKN
jgi:hypothetical protein